MIQLQRFGRFSPFIAGGATNSLLSYLAFLAAALIAPPAIAYTVAYVFGIGSSYFINSHFVFKTAFSKTTLFAFPIVYVFQYLFGLGLLIVLVDGLHIVHWLAMLLVMAVSVPLT